MNDQDKQFFQEMLLQANQSGKKETSDLWGEVKGVHERLELKVDGINKRLDNLNGSVAKHNDKLATHDVINAQNTLILQGVVDSLKEIKTKDGADVRQTSNKLATLEKYQNEQIGSINTFKWLFGFLGTGNVIIFLKVVLGLF